MNKYNSRQPSLIEPNRLPGISNDILFLKPSISSGINCTDPPHVFTFLFEKEIKNKFFIKNYTNRYGYPILVNSIKFYESKKYGVDLDELGQDVCVTMGGTAAISFLFEYINQITGDSSILLLGLSYYLFYMCAEHYSIPLYTLVSNVKNLKKIKSLLNKNGLFIRIVDEKDPDGIYNNLMSIVNKEISLTDRNPQIIRGVDTNLLIDFYLLKMGIVTEKHEIAKWEEKIYVKDLLKMVKNKQFPYLQYASDNAINNAIKKLKEALTSLGLSEQDYFVNKINCFSLLFSQ